MKYHLKDGYPAECTATKRECRFMAAGINVKHFDTYEEALEYSQQQNSEAYGGYLGYEDDFEEEVGFHKIKTKAQVKKQKQQKTKKSQKETKIKANKKMNEMNNEIFKSEKYKKEGISFYPHEIKRNVKSYHARIERKERLEKIDKLLGEGKRVSAFYVVEEKRKPTIHVVHDNGVIKIYGAENQVLVTEYVATPGKLHRLYNSCGLKLPSNLFSKALDNTQKNYNKF